MSFNNSNNEIRPATRVSLHKAGFKPVPLSADNKPAMEWTPVYDSSNFWSVATLVGTSNCWHGVATVFGETHLRGARGEPLYLHGLDVDSESVHLILGAPLSSKSEGFESLIAKLTSLGGQREGNGIKVISCLDAFIQSTFVTKTRKPYGHHVYWLEPMQHRAIHSHDCKPGSELEIKTDKSSGHCTLPPSAHRNDPGFRYTSIGRTDVIALIPGL